MAPQHKADCAVAAQLLSATSLLRFAVDVKWPSVRPACVSVFVRVQVCLIKVYTYVCMCVLACSHVTCCLFVVTLREITWLQLRARSLSLPLTVLIDETNDAHLVLPLYAGFMIIAFVLLFVIKAG